MTTATASPLIDAPTLRALLAGPNPPAVLDTGFDLADPALGERRYRDDGHVPGAHYLHLERDLSAPTRGDDGRFRGRHPLPERAVFAATIGALGIDAATPVVVYDRHGATFAGRAWWMLRWLGHRPVALLDGGWQAWTAAGGAVERGDGPPRAADAAPYRLHDAPPAMPTIDADALQAALGRVLLLDARAAERFRGDSETLDARAGHIPGAGNRFFKLNLGPDGRFKPADVLRAEFAALLGATTPAGVVHSCGSGVTACHNLLAMEIAGLPGARLYPGSWSEWSADPERPIAIG